MNAGLLSGLLLIGVVLSACAPAPPETTYRNASVDDLAAMLERGDDFLLVNTHVPYEGHIEGTDDFWTFDDLPLDRLPADKDTRIVLYGRSGRMSAIAAQALADLGYTDVTDIGGGMIAWQRSGREVVNATSD